MEPTLETIADKEPTLEDLQEKVGGLIEVVRLMDGSQLIVNEEGTIHDLPHNSKASAVAQQPIVGNAVVLRGDARLT
jgi:hypothetical protein|tara:strand:- start:300 stop:530 length:231 start_codon:yes stop_codon:yes gene_type:complete